MFWKPPLGTQLNRTHPLTRGLVGCWLMNEGSGLYLNDYSGQHWNATIVKFKWNPDGLSSNVVDSAIRLKTQKPLDGGTAFSIVTRLKFYDISTDRGIFYTERHSSTLPLLFWADNATIDHFALVMNTSAGVSGSLFSGTAIKTNVWYSVVLTWDGIVIRLYINGTEDTTGDFPYSLGGKLDSTSAEYRLGNDDIYNRDFNGVFSYAYIYNKGLLDNEARQLHIQPYAMFEQPKNYWVVETGPPIPGIPVIIGLNGDSQNTITVSKTANTSMQHIYWSLTAGVTKENGTKIADITSLYEHINLTKQNYYYIATSENEFCESDESNEICLKPDFEGKIFNHDDLAKARLLYQYKNREQ